MEALLVTDTKETHSVGLAVPHAVTRGSHSPCLRLPLLRVTWEFGDSVPGMGLMLWQSGGQAPSLFFSTF